MLLVDPNRVTLVVSGEPRTIPRRWWDALEGPHPPSGWNKSNGCTASPDYWMGTTIWPACVVHDWHYAPDSGPEITREYADAAFRRNLSLLMKLQGAPWYRRAYISFTYWRAVRRLGGRHFKRDGNADGLRPPAS